MSVSLAFSVVFHFKMHCDGVFHIVNLIAVGVFCANWDIFQDYGSASSDTTFTLSDTGEFNPFIINEDPSAKLNLDGTSTVANQEDSFTPFDSGDLDTFSDHLGSSSLLAGVNDACSLSPVQKIRARADGGASCRSSSVNLPSLSSDVLLDESLQIPRFGRKITDYEDADQRLVGQAYCPSHKIMLPGLILPVCDSGVPGFAQELVSGALYTVINGFLSMLSPPLFTFSPRPA